MLNRDEELWKWVKEILDISSPSTTLMFLESKFGLPRRSQFHKQAIQLMSVEIYKWAQVGKGSGWKKYTWTVGG